MKEKLTVSLLGQWLTIIGALFGASLWLSAVGGDSASAAEIAGRLEPTVMDNSRTLTIHEERLRTQDEDLDYIRNRVDAVYDILVQNNSGGNQDE